MERVKSVRLVDKAESVVTARQHGRNVIPRLLVLGVINHAYGAMPAFLEEVVGVPNVIE
jgi:hypothetical protein